MLVRDGDERIRPRQQFLAGAGRPIDPAGSRQRREKAEWPIRFACLLDRRLASEAPLIEVAQATQVIREIIKQWDQGVLEEER